MGLDDLSQSAWPKLFAALERAGVEYPSLHRAITAFFAARRCGSDSDALADVTLLGRLARKIDEGKEIRSFVAYAKAIAGLVYREYLKNQEKFRQAVRELEYRRKADVQNPEEEPDLRRRCQKFCVGGLSESERQLMVDYYLPGEDTDALAEKLGLRVATLRTRIHRLKLRLEKCVDDCRRRA